MLREGGGVDKPLYEAGLSIALSMLFSTCFSVLTVTCVIPDHSDVSREEVASASSSIRRASLHSMVSLRQWAGLHRF